MSTQCSALIALLRLVGAAVLLLFPLLWDELTRKNHGPKRIPIKASWDAGPWELAAVLGRAIATGKDLITLDKEVSHLALSPYSRMPTVPFLSL
jgi:hypothetical protein